MAIFFLLKDKAGRVTHECEQSDPVGMTPEEVAEATRKGNNAASYELVDPDQVNPRLMQLVEDRTIDLKTATLISTNFHERHRRDRLIAEGE